VWAPVLKNYDVFFTFFGKTPLLKLFLTMAVNPDWMAMYQGLGFSNEAATRLSMDQGMHTLEELQLLKDDEVESLCKVIRRPGGVVMNFGDDGDDVAIPNPGTLVSL
jgi:hypothetical protein